MNSITSHPNIDIKENSILQIDEELLSILIKDRTTGKNILGCTDSYVKLGKKYRPSDQIQIKSITNNLGEIIKPRIKKSQKERKIRIKEKGEVFTPSGTCNKQNNSIDEQGFKRKNVFNLEDGIAGVTNKDKILFSKGQSWQNYVKLLRLEITCGEAPYLVSRYDTTTGKGLNVKERIGILDRKLRIVSENTKTEKEWFAGAKIAYQSTYGYEGQGDSLLIARENLLYSFIDFYLDKFQKQPSLNQMKIIANIISWNIWQMDGLKYVVPNTCKTEKIIQMSLFDNESEQIIKCSGCLKGNPFEHNGIYCKIKDGNKNEIIKFVDILKE